ncbi:serine protease Asp [Aeromonas sp. EERV15]|uniref:serine protease Asp n=1 Tax=Aeromonas sp. EERV15 TaxID=1833892 RepID=UPI00083AF1E5|nr:S8 family serine peptidase [Aeromonas sp. EERV15]
MKQTSLALAITALLSTLPSALVQANEGCAPLTGKESGVDIGRSSTERCLPGTNPLQDQQWYLLNSGQDGFSARGGIAGNDLNLWWAHRTGVLGQGINVAVVDDGLAIAHPDLADNVRPGSKNVVTGSDDPTPTDPDTAHGTSVSGIIAAVDNAIGTKGIAPRAQLQGFNLLDDNSQQLQKDWLYALGDSDASRDNRVFNQSYGMSVVDPRAANSLDQSQLDRLFEQQTLKAQGAAYIKAAGNGFNKIAAGGYVLNRTGNGPKLPFENSNLDPSNSNFWNLVVSALNANGSRSSYSSVGSNVFLSATGGEYGTDSPAMVTTDLPGCDMGYNRTNDPSTNRLHGNQQLDASCDYNGVMNGTSSATPSTSGAMALLMSAYPDLPVRDLRDLLARSATRVDATHKPVMVSYTSNSGKVRDVKGLEGWERNAAGMWFSPTYGFGLIDVNKALELAANHQPQPPLVQLPWQKINVSGSAAAIPDVGNSPTSSTTRIATPLTVEAVQVMVSLDHQRLPDLLIELVSPAGTRSILLSPFNSLVGQSLDQQQLGFVRTKGLRDMRMLSNKFYGESAQGTWRLEVTDVANGTRQVSLLNRETRERTTLTERNNRQPGKLISWSLRVLGHDANRS